MVLIFQSSLRQSSVLTQTQQVCFRVSLQDRGVWVRTPEPWPCPANKKVLPQLAPDGTRISCGSSDGPRLRSLRNTDQTGIGFPS